MFRRYEREQARSTLIENAAVYLDAGGELQATVIERLPAGGRLVIEMRIVPEAENPYELATVTGLEPDRVQMV